MEGNLGIAASKNTVHDSYLKLIRQFPPRPIRSTAEYDKAFAIVEKLAVRGEDDLDAGEQDYLDGIVEFIAIYGRSNFLAIDEGTPLKRLRYVIEQSGVSATELQKLLGCSQSLISLILSGKRELTKDHIRKLADRFSISTSYFM